MKEEQKNKSYFEILNDINVNDKIEEKNGLKYLSWAYAWGEAKKKFPNANYRIYERETNFGPVNYFTDGKTAWVKTGVIINDIEHIEQLPVMDYRNKSISIESITSFDVNKTIQRSLTKALARHGLGLYIYAGEDIPDDPMTKEEAEKFVLTFGKYKGMTIKELVDTEDSYVDYLLNTSKDSKILEVIKLLTGKEKPTDEENQEIQKLLAELEELILKTETDRDKLYGHYQVKNNSEMTKEQLIDAINILKQKVGN